MELIQAIWNSDYHLLKILILFPAILIFFIIIDQFKFNMKLNRILKGKELKQND